MKFVKLECPNCGGKLKLKDNIKEATCIHCGYDFVVDTEKPEIHNHYYADTAKNGQPYQKSTLYTFNTNGNKKTVKNNGAVGAFIAVFVILAIIFSNVFSNKKSEVKIASIPDLIAPQSSAMIKFSEYIFNKSIDSISSEDYSSIKYLKVSSDDDIWSFDYSTHDYSPTDSFESTIKHLSFNDNTEIPKADFQPFVGLTHLYLNGNIGKGNLGYNESVSLKGLKKLTAYGGSISESLNALSSSFHSAGLIKEISVSLYSDEDIEALLQFGNLEKLELRYLSDDLEHLDKLGQLKSIRTIKADFSMKDISWLSSFDSLTALDISAYYVTDYQILYGLVKMEKLTLDTALELKDISFVRSMPNLKEFMVSNSKILSLEPINGKTSMQKLTLGYNSSLADVSAIKSLTSLTELNVDLLHNTVLPSLNSFNHLSSASIPSNQLGSINKISSIKKLSLNGRELILSELLGLSNLENLSLNRCYLAKDSSLTELDNLPKLKELNLYDFELRNYKEYHQLFMLKNVEKLSLSDEYYEINPELLGTNTSLKSLTILDNCYIYPYGTERDKSNFSSFSKLNQSFPNMEQLSLSSSKITSLDFVQYMPKLKELYVNDNYVSDISPLTALENLEILQITQNDISNIELLPKNINILADSKGS